MKFVLFHGAFGSPDDNWFPELKEQLTLFGQEVTIPRFPVESWNELTKSGPLTNPQKQSLQSWFDTFKTFMKSFQKDDKLCFIGHSFVIFLFFTWLKDFIFSWIVQFL